MKKTLATLLSLLIIGSSIAFADVLPPNKKSISVCATITNAATHPEFTLIYYTSHSAGPYDSQQNPAPSLVKEGDCINSTGNMYYSRNVYALDTTYWQTQSSNAKYDPSKDSQSYQLNFGSEAPMNDLVDQTSALTTIKYYYEIKDSSTTQDTKFINLTLTKKITNLDDAFTDVKTGDKYLPSVSFLKQNGYVKGYDDGSYKPEQTINRAEFTKIVMHDFKSTKTYDCSKQIFKDVSTDAGNWYRDYVCKAFNEGIIMGFGDNTFRPEQPITFAEAAKIILKVEGVDTAGVSDPWHKEFINVFTKLAIVPTSIFMSEVSSAGMSTQPNPNKQITRGEMALLIRGVVDPLVKNESDPSKIDPLYTPLYGFETAPAQAETNLSSSIDIWNMAFAPTTLTIKKGSTVTWTNGDPFGHDVTSDTGSELASGIIHTNETYSHTFNNVGTFDYHCAIHPSMKASIIVTE